MPLGRLTPAIETAWRIRSGRGDCGLGPRSRRATHAARRQRLPAARVSLRSASRRGRKCRRIPVRQFLERGLWPARCWRCRRRSGQGRWFGEWSAPCEVRRAGAGARGWDRGRATGGAEPLRVQPAADQPALHPQLPPTPLSATTTAAGSARRRDRSDRDRRGGRHSASGELHEPAAKFYPRWLPVDTGSRRWVVVRTMTDLHGAFVAAASDGNPAITPLGFGRGETRHVHYTNQTPQMKASMLWFHDHGARAPQG